MLSVGPMRSAIRLATETLSLVNDVPRSPVAAPAIQRRNRIGIGSSSPSWRSTWAMHSMVAPSPQTEPAMDPRASMATAMAKEMTAMANSKGTIASKRTPMYRATCPPQSVRQKQCAGAAGSGRQPRHTTA